MYLFQELDTDGSGELLFRNGLRNLGASGTQFTWSRENFSQRLDRTIVI